MIDQIDRQIKSWVEGIVDGVTISLERPDYRTSGKGAFVYLIMLTDRPPPRGPKRPPLQLTLRYLVTTWAETPEEAHKILGELVFAAMDNPEFGVEFNTITISDWTVFGISPQPYFILSVPLRLDREGPIETKLVRKPLVIRAAPVTSLKGAVLSLDDVPIAGAVVEIPILRLFSRTDAEGRFSFPTVPASPAVNLLRVRAKGREFDIEIDRSFSDGEPLLIRFDPN